jgi:predicted nucleic acid-binding Zn ribbon protein
MKFQTLNYAGTRYCSQKCRSLSGYRSSKSNRICVLCGKEFVSQRGKACSRLCGANLAAKNRRENRQNDTISAIK